MTQPPRLLLILVLLISLVCALSAIGGVVLAVLGDAWFLLAFEVVVLLASGMGLMIGLGKLRDAPALGTFCIGGCVLVAAVLSEPTLMARVLQGGSSAPKTIAGVNMLHWSLARICAGATLIIISALLVLSRRPAASIPFLVRSILFGLPVVATLSVLVAPPVRSTLVALPLAAIVAIVIAAFFVLGALFSVSAHNLIRAFEVAIPGATTAGKKEAAGV